MTRAPKSSDHYDSGTLYSDLLTSLDAQGFTESEKYKDIVDWCSHLIIGGRPFQIEGHEYEREMLLCDSRVQVFQKAAQVGITEVRVLKAMHGLIFGEYPQGVLYLFPSQGDVTDFSKGRFSTLIRDNPQMIGIHCTETDASGIKRVGKSMLHLRGGKSTSKIAGSKKSSSQLKSVPADLLVIDELDEFDQAMKDLAVHRLDHSTVKQECYLSTPTLPDFGISKLYEESDQRIWLIRCSHCGTETCLELDFPNCLIETAKGTIRACKKCRRQIFPAQGHWEPRYPGRDTTGFWISQLNSVFVEPSAVLAAYNNPPNGNLTEVMNSALGMPHIASDSRLSLGEVFSCCGDDPMRTKEVHQTAAGIDVGKVLNIIVAYRPAEEALEVVYMARVSSFQDVHDICKRFNVGCAVFDREPETRKVLEFQSQESFPVFACDYQNSARGGAIWDEKTGTVKINRTECMDGSYQLFANPGRLVLPRRCDELDEFAKHCRNVAKVLEEDELGSRVYVYRRLGADHYYHSLGYTLLASQQIRISDSRYNKHSHDRKSEIDFDPFHYNNERPEWT